MQPRRMYAREFKLEVCHQIEVEVKTIAQLCREHGLNRSLIEKWWAAYRARGDEAFPGSAGAAERPLVDAEKRIAQLEAALGRAHLENELLLAALGRKRQPPRSDAR